MLSYLNLYLLSCSFEISTTNRYTSIDEAAIIARKDIEKGNIRFLYSILVGLRAEEGRELDETRRNFSVVETTCRNVTSLLLSPARFLHHNCEPNAHLEPSGLGLKVVANRKIWTSEEITVEYSRGYFGERNQDCLYRTCRVNTCARQATR